MIFEDFLVYLKTLDLPDAYRDAIATLKPYGCVTLQFERVLGQPGEALVLSDIESLRCLYQFVYWALNRDAVDVNVPLIETSYGSALSMDVMISNVGCETPYEEEALMLTRMDWATLLIHLREDYGVALTDDAKAFIYDVGITHAKDIPFVNCNVLFERIT